MRFRSSASLPLSLLLLGVVMIFSACSGDEGYPVLRPDGSIVRIDLSRLEEDRPIFYSVELDDRRVDIFVASVTGRPRAFLDACRECFPANRGFEGTTGYVRCRSCNEIYPIEKLESGLGGCAPVPVKAETDEKILRIPVAALRKALSELQ